MSRRVSVHHFVANLTTRQYGSHSTSDLLGVEYWHDVPADAEFPRLLGRLDLFTRFYPTKPRPVEFSVRVLWVDHPSGSPRVIARFGPELVSFRRSETVRDCVFKAINLRLGGSGRYQIYLLRKHPDDWTGRRYLVLGETHFFVRK